MNLTQIIRKRRKERQNTTAFAPYLNGTQGTAFAMPANAFLFVKPAAATTDGQAALTAGDKTLHVPVLAAGQVYECGWFEKDVSVKSEAGFTLMIDEGLGRYAAIGALA